MKSRSAYPRLGTLRRVAVYAWHCGFAVPLREIDRFGEAGFSEAERKPLVPSLTGVRIGRR